MSSRLQDLFAGHLKQELIDALQGGELASPPCFHTRSQVLSMSWKLPAILECSVYEHLIHALKSAFHTDIDLQIQSESQDASIACLAAYTAHFASKNPALRPFLSVHPTLADDGSLRFASFEIRAVQEMEDQAAALEAVLKTAGIERKISCVLEEDHTLDVPAAAVRPPAEIHRPRPAAKQTAAQKKPPRAAKTGPSRKRNR